MNQTWKLKCRSNSAYQIKLSEISLNNSKLSCVDKQFENEHNNKTLKNSEAENSEQFETNNSNYTGSDKQNLYVLKKSSSHFNILKIEAKLEENFCEITIISH